MRRLTGFDRRIAVKGFLFRLIRWNDEGGRVIILEERSKPSIYPNLFVSLCVGR